MTGQGAVVKEPIWFEARREMSLGLMLPVRERSMGGETPSFEDLVAMAGTAREAGFEVIWFADHFTMGAGDEMAGAWEAWTMMAALAARVPDVQIGPMVSCAGFRNPGVIAKMAEAIDEISGGRFIVGLGAGWNEVEYKQFGFPFDHRASRFEDAIRIVHPLLRDGQAQYDGTFSQANEAVNQPRGPRKNGAPLLIGSNGKRLLKTVARYADAWNSDWQSDPAKMRELIAQVDAACQEAGRSPSTIVKTGMARFAMRDGAAAEMDAITGTPEEMARRLVEMRCLGLKHFVCGLEPRTLSSVEQFGEVIAAYDSLSR
jgi:alkanesulfonate monooxygenase SsuD/methylene tetrahydromethanopterin reductase-like flavin-dependent oxidoreductase (luciferase family)